MKKPIYFIDLTHESDLGLGSDHMPLQLGLIAAYVLKLHPDDVEVEIFKFAKDFEAAVKRKPPWIVAASNYMWNLDLEYKFASAVKEKYPDTIVVFGGPNYPVEADLQEAWLHAYPNVDFYVYRDGEIPFAGLVGALLAHDLRTVKAMNLPSCHALLDGVPHLGPLAPRLSDLTVVPSPYTAGLMDKFFEDNLVPSMQTNRGCPFTCTFCVEGESYYTKVYKTSGERKKKEVDYIVARVKRTKTLRIVDSNFGMFAEDEEFCRYLGEVQARTGYPDFISCSTGKNQKERVLRCAAFLKGAMRLTASVQSLDTKVLEAIKRKNIALDGLIAMSDVASDGSGHFYSEVILGLQEGSLKEQQENFRQFVNQGFNNITQHQFALLPSTEGASRESRKKYGLQSMFRPIQRCVGRYHFDGKEILAIDIEEICVGSNTLSFADYLEARRLYLTIGLFYNDRIFGEILALLRLLDLSVWEWIHRVHGNISHASPAVRELYDEFMRDTRAELWDSPEALVCDVVRDIDRYIEGAAGGNIIYKYRSRSILGCFAEIHGVAFQNLRAYLAERGVQCEDVVRDIEHFSLCQKNNIVYNTDFVCDEIFGSDVIRLLKDHLLRGTGRIDEIRRPTRIRIAHTEAQKKDIAERLAFYGQGLSGLTMAMSRYPVKRWYRTAAVPESVSV